QLTHCRLAMMTTTQTLPTNGPTTLPFPAKFQTRVLRLCLDSPEWLPHLKPAYFDHPLEGQALRILQRMSPPVTLRTLAMECLRKLGRPATRNVLMPLQTRLTEADRTY